MSSTLSGHVSAPVLSSEEWLTIQVYVRTALALPTNEASMRQQLLMQPDEAIEPFQKIIDAYKNISAHCKCGTTRPLPRP